jgi:hypothetical protein
MVLEMAVKRMSITARLSSMSPKKAFTSPRRAQE